MTPTDIDETEARMRQMEAALKRAMCEDMYRPLPGPFTLPPPRPWTERLSDGWYRVRCWISENVLRVEPPDDDLWR